MLKDIVTDAKGSVVATGDAGDLHARGYAPYGYAPKGDSALSALGYNGEYADPVTGDYHLGNGYRAFSPSLMRFTAPDDFAPFGGGGLNTYAYCSGNPINASDPSGHMPKWLAETLIWGSIGIAGLSLVAVPFEARDLYRLAKAVRQEVSSGGEMFEMGPIAGTTLSEPNAPARGGAALDAHTVGGMGDAGPVPRQDMMQALQNERRVVTPNSGDVARTSRLESGALEAHGGARELRHPPSPRSSVSGRAEVPDTYRADASSSAPSFVPPRRGPPGYDHDWAPPYDSRTPSYHSRASSDFSVAQSTSTASNASNASSEPARWGWPFADVRPRRGSSLRAYPDWIEHYHGNAAMQQRTNAGLIRCRLPYDRRLLWDGHPFHRPPGTVLRPRYSV
jgi:RHS repeat-associated protein